MPMLGILEGLLNLSAGADAFRQLCFGQAITDCVWRLSNYDLCYQLKVVFPSLKSTRRLED